MKWAQLPESIRNAAYALGDGEVSDVIAGPGKRLWIIKVVGHRAREGATFESTKLGIKNILKDDRIRELRAQTESALGDAAKIEYSKTPSPRAE